MKLKNALMLCSAALSACCASAGRAETVTWTIDSSQSWIRMQIPDQNIDIGGGTVIFAGLRGAQPIYDVNLSANENPPVVAWTDDRGARAPIAGTLTTNYTEGSNIQFTQANNNFWMVETGQWIPNRDLYVPGSPNVFTYHRPQDPLPNGGRAAAFAVELTIAGFVRVGHVTLYRHQPSQSGLVGHLDGTANLSGSGPWNQSGGTLNIGGASNGTNLDFWHTSDNSLTTRDAPASSSIGANSGSLQILNTGGQNRQLRIPINAGFLMEISGLPLQDAVFSGELVANATLTSPAPALVNARPYHSTFPGADKVDTGVSLIQRSGAPQQAVLNNITSSSQGINGVVLDFDNLANLGDISLEYKMSPQNVFATPIQDWVDAPAPASASLLANAGQAGSDRVLVTWANNAIQNRYLCIKVIYNGSTIAELYLGHLKGEQTAGNGSVFGVSYAADLQPIRLAVGTAPGADGRPDVDKNGQVQLADIVAMRTNAAAQLTQVTIPANP